MPAMTAMTAVYFVNVLRLLIIRVPRVPGANINEVPNSEKFSHSAGGPQLELRWGPGRAKRARARHTYTKTRKTAKSHLFSELGEMLGNTALFKKKKKNPASFPFYLVAKVSNLLLSPLQIGFPQCVFWMTQI